MAKNPSWFAVIAEEVRSVRSDRRSLRKFGLTMGIALALFGLLFLWRHPAGAPWFFGFAAGFLIFAAVLPVALRPVQKLWMTLAYVLGWVMTRLLLTIIFYIGITPVALIARLVGKKFLDLEFEPDRESYWEKRQPHDRGMERYESQF